MSCLALDVETTAWLPKRAAGTRFAERPRLERRAMTPLALSELDEKDLLRRCQEGDEAAFGEVVDRYTDRVFWVAYNVVGDHDEARDISQEAFLKLFRSIARYEIDKNFYTWLYKIVVNVSIDFLRKKKTSSGRANVSLDRVGEIEDAAEAPIPRLERQDLGREIQRVLELLPPKYRTVLVLRNVEGMNCREIADVLEANHATVRWQLHKARQLFIEMWNGDLHPAGEGLGDESASGEGTAT